MASFQTLCTAKTLEAVEALRGIWTSLDIRDMDADIDGFVALIQACEGNARPHVVHLRRHDADGARDLLAVARVEQVSIPLKIGYRALCTFRVPALVTSFGGFLGVVDEADAQALVKELRLTIAGGDADLLILRSVETDGSLDRAVSTSRLSHRQTTAQRWLAPLGGSLDAFLQSRSGKTRKRLRWEERVFRQTFGERLQMRRFDKPEHLDLICRDAESVASRTYQRGLGVSFRASPFERAMTAMALEQGWHRTWVLYLD